MSLGSMGTDPPKVPIWTGNLEVDSWEARTLAVVGYEGER